MRPDLMKNEAESMVTSVGSRLQRLQLKKTGGKTTKMDGENKGKPY